MMEQSHKGAEAEAVQKVQKLNRMIWQWKIYIRPFGTGFENATRKAGHNASKNKSSIYLHRMSLSSVLFCFGKEASMPSGHFLCHFPCLGSP